jgi:hypothetical protein
VVGEEGVSMLKKKVKRFNIESIEDPELRGIADQFRLFRGKYQIDFGKPLPIETGSFVIKLSEQQFFSLSRSDVEGQKKVPKAKARLIHYVDGMLRTTLPKNPSELNLEFKLNQSDIDELVQIDPDRISRGGWTDIGREETKQVFISCGQQTKQETTLGDEIVRLVEEKTEFEGYFAEFQDSMEGVTSHIFQALQDSAGFVAVMHRRDKLSKEYYRGSVWIEQEIAIVAFLAQSLGKDIPVRMYRQKGIRRDGVRGYIMHAPIEFETNDEVLADLIPWLEGLAKSE